MHQRFTYFAYMCDAFRIAHCKETNLSSYYHNIKRSEKICKPWGTSLSSELEEGTRSADVIFSTPHFHSRKLSHFDHNQLVTTPQLLQTKLRIDMI